MKKQRKRTVYALGIYGVVKIKGVVLSSDSGIFWREYSDGQTSPFNKGQWYPKFEDAAAALKRRNVAAIKRMKKEIKLLEMSNYEAPIDGTKI